MIRNESEYQVALVRLEEEAKRIEERRCSLVECGLSKDELKRALDPVISFHLQFKEEVEAYERLKRGDVGELTNLHGLGQLLVSVRIARGISQRELAQRLGVNESSVSRDERNEYHGISVSRAARILDALGVELKSLFERPVLRLEGRMNISAKH